MHPRRLTTFLLGLWLGGGLLVAWVVADSFSSVDRLLATPSIEAATRLKPIPAPAVRMLFRYEVAERNRTLFQDWEYIQLVGGSLFFFYLLFGTKERKFPIVTVLFMIGLVFLQRFLVTPELISYGRNLDFAPPNAPSNSRERFWLLHNGYLVLEALKWGAALLLAGRNIVAHRRESSEVALDEFDLIDKSNHGHVNR